MGPIFTSFKNFTCFALCTRKKYHASCLSLVGAITKYIRLAPCDFSICAANEIIDRVVPDQKQNDEAKLKLTALVQSGDLEHLKTARDVIVAEAKGESSLQRNWRPLLMCIFGVIIANNYIIAPYLEAIFGVSIVLEIPPDMWELLKIGVGGYIVGRSSEKAVKAWKGQ